MHYVNLSSRRSSASPLMRSKHVAVAAILLSLASACGDGQEVVESTSSAQAEQASESAAETGLSCGAAGPSQGQDESVPSSSPAEMDRDVRVAEVADRSSGARYLRQVVPLYGVAEADVSDGRTTVCRMSFDRFSEYASQKFAVTAQTDNAPSSVLVMLYQGTEGAFTAPRAREGAEAGIAGDVFAVAIDARTGYESRFVLTSAEARDLLQGSEDVQ